MIEPYQALGLVPTMRGIRRRADFNIRFILDPDGEVILRHHKVVPLLPVEHSVTPHNARDRWTGLYGRNLDTFYPVAETAIGRLGFLDRI